MRVQDDLKKEKLYYPGVDYTAKKDKPVLEDDLVRYILHLEEQLI